MLLRPRRRRLRPARDLHENAAWASGRTCGPGRRLCGNTSRHVEALYERRLRVPINVSENRRPDPWAPGADGNFGVPSERGARDLSVVRLMLLVPWAAQAVPRHLD